MYLTAYDFRQFAEECLARARKATTKARRDRYLAMADMWTRAADKLEPEDNECALSSTRRANFLGG